MSIIKRQIKLAILGTVFLLFGLFVIVMAWGGHFQSKKVLNKGGCAIAEITDKKIERTRIYSDEHSSVDYDIYYSFKIEDKETIKGPFKIKHEKVIKDRSSIKKKTWDNLKIGDSIEIAYDIDNPNYNFPVIEASLVPIGMPIVFSVFGVMFIFVGGFLFARSFKKDAKEIGLKGMSQIKSVRGNRYTSVRREHNLMEIKNRSSGFSTIFLTIPGIFFLIFGVVMLLGSFGFIPGEGPPLIFLVVGAVFASFGAVFLFFGLGRRGIILDKIRQKVIVWYTLIVPLKKTEYPLFHYNRVTVSEKKRREENIYAVYPVQLWGIDNVAQVNIQEYTDYQEALATAEEIASFLGIPVDDSVTGQKGLFR